MLQLPKEFGANPRRRGSVSRPCGATRPELSHPPRMRQTEHFCAPQAICAQRADNREEGLPDGDEDAAGREELKTATAHLVAAMIAVADYFEHAIAGYVARYGVPRGLDDSSGR